MDKIDLIKELHASVSGWTKWTATIGTALLAAIPYLVGKTAGTERLQLAFSIHWPLIVGTALMGVSVGAAVWVLALLPYAIQRMDNCQDNSRLCEELYTTAHPNYPPWLQNITSIRWLLGCQAMFFVSGVVIIAMEIRLLRSQPSWGASWYLKIKDGSTGSQNLSTIPGGMRPRNRQTQSQTYQTRGCLQIAAEILLKGRFSRP
jgi:hypothetical protein